MILKEKISGKKILFFSVQTFNLEKEIKQNMEENGAIVTYYDERPSNNNFTKGIIRLKRKFYQKKIDEYYQNILKATEKVTFDFLFVNRGEVITTEFFIKFKVQQPTCKLIFFTWDSFTNNSHPTKILKYFDRTFTFDPVDAVKFGLNFRPLFFLDSYKKIKNKSSDKFKFDLVFCGTAHSDRYSISDEISQWCEQNNLKMFCYYYMHGRLVYFYKKLFDKTFKKFDFSKLSFKSLTTDEIAALYEQSNIILDINHPGQKGLTMRTFESVGAKKKLITTNFEIKKYPFYNSNNILVIDRNNIQLNKLFFETKYEEIDPKLYDKMSIAGWLKEIFEEDNANTWINGI